MAAFGVWRPFLMSSQRQGRFWRSWACHKYLRKLLTDCRTGLPTWIENGDSQGFVFIHVKLPRLLFILWATQQLAATSPLVGMG